jgi:AbrB family looped-hinge helix DNA binding protein
LKLQKQLSRRVEGKSYPKYVVTIPPKFVEKLGWKEGTELKADIKDGKIVLRPSNDNETHSKE